MKKFIFIILCMVLSSFKVNAFVIEKKLDVAYGSHLNNKVDMYFPDERLVMPRGVIVWIHGGSWWGGDKRDGSELPLVDALAQGYAIISVNYRLVGDGGEFPNNMQDISDVVAAVDNLGCQNCLDKNAWLKLKVYTQKGIMVSGGSAGGHLAVMGAGAYLKYKKKGSSNIRCINNNYGPLDLRPRHLYWQDGLKTVDNMANGATMNDISPSYYMEQGVLSALSQNSRFGLKWIVNYNLNDTLIPAATMKPFVDQLASRRMKYRSFVADERADPYHGVSVETSKKFLYQSIDYCFSD